MRRIGSWVSACLMLPVVSAATCGANLPEKGRQIARGDGIEVAFVPSAWPLPVGQHFELVIALCPTAEKPLPSRIQVDADMPAHKHGMNYRAMVKAQKDGLYSAQGLMFHMPGRWRFIFDLDYSDRRSRVVTELEVE